MITPTINSDPISEKYARCVIEIQWKQQVSFLLWGADTTVFNENDKFLVNRQGLILLFVEVESLIQYIRDNNFIAFDEETTKAWARQYAGSIAYSSFDFDHIRSSTQTSIDLNAISEQHTSTLLNFINFFGDYAHQREAEGRTLLTLYRRKSIETFFDFAYDTHFWTSPDDPGYQSLDELDFLHFDEEDFRITVRQMIELFMANTVTWTSR